MRLDAFAREQFRSQLGDLREELTRARRDSDENAVHDVRVAIRRFSQVLSVFARLLPADKAKAVRKKLRSLMAAAGKTRDLDVALELIGARAPVSLRKTLAACRWKAAAKLERRLHRALAGDWPRKWSECLSVADTGRQAMVFATALLRPAERAFLKQGDLAALPRTAAADLHKFRIAAKRFRYSLEVFAPLDTARFVPRIEAIRGIQQILGDANDCVVTTEMVTMLRGPAAIERRLLARHRRLTAQFRRDWPKTRSAIAAKPS